MGKRFHEKLHELKTWTALIDLLNYQGIGWSIFIKNKASAVCPCLDEEDLISKTKLF